MDSIQCSSSLEVLRQDTQELCQRLEAFAARLRDGAGVPEDLSDQFNGQFRYEALALAFAMIEYLPRTDPRVIIVMDRAAPCEGPTLAGPLQMDKHTAVEQLTTIASILRKLAASIDETRESMSTILDPLPRTSGLPSTCDDFSLQPTTSDRHDRTRERPASALRENSIRLLELTGKGLE